MNGEYTETERIFLAAMAEAHNTTIEAVEDDLVREKLRRESKEFLDNVVPFKKLNKGGK